MRRADQKLFTAHDIFQKRFRAAIVRDVAPALSRNINFFARLFVLFKNGDGGAAEAAAYAAISPDAPAPITATLFINAYNEISAEAAASAEDVFKQGRRRRSL